MTSHSRLDRLLGHFDYAHLPPHLQVVSGRFATVANLLRSDLAGTDDDMLAMALEHLLIAKDAAVRVAVAQAEPLLITHHLDGGKLTHHRNASSECGLCQQHAAEMRPGVRDALHRAEAGDDPVLAQAARETLEKVPGSIHYRWCADLNHPSYAPCPRPLVGPDNGKDGGK